MLILKSDRHRAAGVVVDADDHGFTESPAALLLALYIDDATVEEAKALGNASDGVDRIAVGGLGFTDRLADLLGVGDRVKHGGFFEIPDRDRKCPAAGDGPKLDRGGP